MPRRVVALVALRRVRYVCGPHQNIGCRLKKLRVVRPGAQVEDAHYVGFTWTLPPLSLGSNTPPELPTRAGTRFDAVDATAVLEPSRWEKFVLARCDREVAPVQWARRSAPRHPISQALDRTTPWRPDAVPDGVRVRRATTRRGEARAVIRDIRTWLVDQQLTGDAAARACDDVIVLVPEGAHVFALWHREFEFGGVPLRSERLESVGVRSFARWVVTLAQLSSWRTQPVARDLLRGIVEAPHWSLTSVAEDNDLRAAVRQLLTTIRRDSFRFDEWVAHVHASAPTESRAAVLRLTATLQQALDQGANFYPRLARLLRDMRVQECARATDEPAIITVVDQVLAAIDRLAYDEDGVTTDPAVALNDALRASWLSRSTMRRHGVRLLSYDCYDGRASKLLFATGLGEGDFPSIPRAFNRQEMLVAWDIGLLRLGETVQDYVDDELERQLRVASHAFDQCAGEVVLSFATEGPGTELRYPGPLLSLLIGGWPESAWYAGNPRVETFGWADEIPRTPNDADSWNDVALFAEDTQFHQWLQSIGEQEPLTATDRVQLETVLQLSAQLETSRAAFRERRPGSSEPIQFGAYSGMLPGAISRTDAFSASALESYGQCGTRYFFGKVLRISDQHDLSEGLEPTETGTIIHGAFATAAHEVVDIVNGRLMSMCVEPGEERDEAVARIQAQLAPHIDRTVRAFTAQQASMSEALIAAVVRRWGGAIAQWLRYHIVDRLPGAPTDEELGEHPAVAEARTKYDAHLTALAAVQQLAAAIAAGQVGTQSAAEAYCPPGMRQPISKTALKTAFKDRAVDELQHTLQTALPELRATLDQVEEAARVELAAHFNRDVAHGELAFGMSAAGSDPHSSAEPLLLDVDGIPVSVKGQIDRVDWDIDRHQLAVRDYKTGRRRTSATLAAEVAVGQHLQLPLYAHAVEELARRGVLPHLSGAPTVEVSLEFPRDPSSRGTAALRLNDTANVLLAGQPAPWREVSSAWLRAHVHNIDAGNFPLLPSKCPIENTGYCDFARACGYATEVGARARDQDPRPNRPDVQAIPEEDAPTDKVVCAEVVPPRCATTAVDTTAARQAHQRAGEAAADVTRDVAVSAGAGTGKTYNLVLRYLAALADGASPSEILCITFTRHAAAEMKKRVREALLTNPTGHERGPDGTRVETTDPQAPYVDLLRRDRRAFRRLLLQLSAAPIMTIDALAGQVFREVQALTSAHVAAPELQIVTEHDVAEQLRTFVRQQFIASLEADDPHLRFLAEELDPIAVRELLLEASKHDVSDALAALATVDERAEYLLQGWYRIMRPAAAELFARLAEWPIAQLLTWLDSARGSTRSAERPTEEAAAWLERFAETVRARGTGSDRNDWLLLREVFQRSTAKTEFGHAEIGKTLRALRAELWGELESTDPERVNACKAFLKSLDELPQYAQTAAHATFVAQRWARGFREHLVQTGRARFGDVEHLALRALDDDATARQIAPQFAFRHIFVDECQDTSYAQIRLIDAMRGLAEHVTGLPCRQFFVGDVKQSIYGFRGAEVDVFTKRVASGAETFTINRRSSPGLIRAFNRLFEPLFGAADGETLLDPRTWMPYAPLVWPPQAEQDDDAEPAVELFCAAGESWFEGATSDEEEEEDEPEIFKSTSLQRGLARRVGELVERYPPGDSGPSIALLVGSWARADFYRDLLHAYEIPAAVQGGRGLLNTPEVEGLLQWLEAAAYPNLRTSFLAALRGPGIALSDAGLYCLRHRYGVTGVAGSFRVTEATDATLDPVEAVRAWANDVGSLDVDRARELLQHDARNLARFQHVWAKLSARLGFEPPSETLASLADQLGLWTFWHGREGGRQAVANLRTAIDLVRDLESTLGQDPWVLLRRLAEMRGNSDPGAGGLEASGGAPVVITTYWQAKGLEWPVVVLPDIEKTRVRTSPRGLGDNRICIVDADFDVVHTPEIRASSSENPLRTSVTAVTDVLDQYRKPAQRAEIRRLLYVAMTRAKRKLVLSGTFEVPRKKEGEEAPTYLHDARDWATTLRVCLGLHVPDGAATLEAAADSPWAPLLEEGVVRLVDGGAYGRGVRQRPAARAPLSPPTSTEISRRWLTIPTEEVRRVRPSDLVQLDVLPPSAALSTPLPQRQELRTTAFASDADLGTAFHYVMEKTAFGLSPIGGVVQVLPAIEDALVALRLDRPASQRAARASEVERLVLNALRAELCDELREAARRGTLYHELPITYLRSDTERVVGVIDLVWRDRRGALHLLDYKTGFRVPTVAQPESEQLRHHYAQVAEYRHGLELCGYEVASFGIWYVDAPCILRWCN